MAGEGEYDVGAVNGHTALMRSLLRLVPDPLVRLWLGDPDEQRRTFQSQLTSLEDDIAGLIDEQATVLDGEHYLTTPERRGLHDDVQEVVDEYDALRLRTWPFPYSDDDLDRLSAVRSDLQRIVQRLEGYNAEFVDRQLERHEELFTDVDEEGHDLNHKQRKAIVRNDEYNQVIAGAGTGKTLVLTHRIAYLIERGVDPERIAAITLTNNATDEIEARLADRFDVTDVDVSTIHSFANAIARDATDRYVTTVDQEDRKNFVEETIREDVAGGTTDFAWHYRQFLTNYSADVPDPGDYQSRAAYVRARAERTYETIAGEEVASQAEKAVADVLFTHGVEYQYESIAGWANTAEGKAAYSPDFYLPEYEAYIEHWGIDERGEVAPWFTWSTAEYLEKLEWAREQFARTDRILIETYDFEHWAGHLERVLEHRLQNRGVALDPMGFDELVDYVLGEYERERHVIALFEKFIDNAGTFDASPDGILERLPRSNPRKYHFGVCGAILLQKYETWKRRNHLRDFDDMFYDAIAAIRDEPASFQDRYDHILVDEFQDVAINQIRLLDALTDGDESPRLFSVGDDWQSIYGFRGAVVAYFVDFQEYFGPAAITNLTETYRCPETVLEASTALIANNPEQIDKEPEACSGRDATPRLHPLDGYDDRQYARRVGEYAATLVDRYVDAGSDPADVMILSRYDSGAPYVDRVKEALEAREIPYDGAEDRYRPSRSGSGSASRTEGDDGGVSVFSAHQAKGREAPHVVLLHVAAGEDGFSPDVRNDDLMTVVRDVEANTAAEERRLFYVALSRTEETLDVLTRAGAESPFLDEIDDYVVPVRSVVDPGEVGERVTITATVSQLWDPHESQQQVGLLEDETGRIKFVAWKNADPPEVEERVRYEFADVDVSEYEGQREIHFTEETTVAAVDR